MRVAARILALACPTDGGGQRPVDNMTVAQLRSHFAGGARGKRGVRGLLLIKGRWYAPEQALSGPPIFGRRRPFVASSSSLEPSGGRCRSRCQTLESALPSCARSLMTDRWRTAIVP